MSDNRGEPRPRPASRPQVSAGRGSLLQRSIDWVERHRDDVAPRKGRGELRGQKARSWTERMLARVVTGAAYAVVNIVCLYAGPLPTAVLFSAMSWLCCSEYYRMVRLGGRTTNDAIGLGAALLYPLSTLLPFEHAALVLTGALLCACALWYVYTPRANISDVAVTTFGPLYTSFALSCTPMIRAAHPGLPGFLLAFGIVLSIWANDTCAYFVGSRFGKHKLAPRISPNKSTEGFWGGIAGSLAVWLVLGIFGVGGLDVALSLLCGLFVGMISVFGDLFESRIKRSVGVKDSGDILPGHGGMLDRCDSLIFGGMAAYVLLHLGGII